MTAEQALYQFWAGFGFPTFEENSVPSGKDAPEFPYLTYSVAFAGFGDPVILNASFYTRSPSWAHGNAFSNAAFSRLSNGGEMLAFDGGALWLKRGTPFVSLMGDDADEMIKRVNLNLMAEMISAR